MAIDFTFYITEKDIKEVTAISDNVDPKSIFPHMKSAQDLIIDPALGTGLAAALKEVIQSKRMITVATIANPVQITTETSHGYTTGDTVFIESSNTVTQINGGFTITVVDATNFTLDGLDGTAHAAFTAGTAFVRKSTQAQRTLLDMLKMPCAFWALHEALPFIWMKIADKSILKKGGAEGDEAATLKDMIWFRSDTKNKGESYMSLVICYIKDHLADYPEYVANCAEIKITKGFKSSIRF